MKNTKSLYDKSYNGRRLIISQDKYNWIIKIGSSKLSDNRFIKESEPGYFTDLKQMFKWLFNHFFKSNIRSFNLKDVLEAIGKAESRIIEIGKALDFKFGKLEGRK